MLQKKLRKVKDWHEWLKLWEENEFLDTAITLLHIGPEMPCLQSPGVVDFKLELDEFYERVGFYLEVAKTDKYPEVGAKAYQVLVHTLLPRLVKLEGFRYSASDPNGIMEIPTWKNIIGFFANRESSVLDKEPYKSEARDFIIRLEISLRKDLSISAPFGFTSETKSSLSQQEKATLASALVNVGAFEHIVNNRIFETIPALEKKIARYCWGYNPGETKMKQKFPDGEEQWRKKLEDIQSDELKFALEQGAPIEIAQTLMTLRVLWGSK